MSRPTYRQRHGPDHEAAEVTVKVPIPYREERSYKRESWEHPEDYGKRYSFKESRWSHPHRKKRHRNDQDEGHHNDKRHHRVKRHGEREDHMPQQRHDGYKHGYHRIVKHRRKRKRLVRGGSDDHLKHVSQPERRRVKRREMTEDWVWKLRSPSREYHRNDQELTIYTPKKRGIQVKKADTEWEIQPIQPRKSREILI